MTEQVAVPPEPESVQGLPLKLPLSAVAQETSPVGVLLPEARVTVAVQELSPPKVMGLVHDTVVVVDDLGVWLLLKLISHIKPSFSYASVLLSTSYNFV